MDYLNIPFD